MLKETEFYSKLMQGGVLNYFEELFLQKRSRPSRYQKQYGPRILL